ncbi:MAG TPA: hypothetical protein V6D50_16175 [Chroococcales cyanobacterium]
MKVRTVFAVRHLECDRATPLGVSSVGVNKSNSQFAVLGTFVAKTKRCFW